MKKILTIGGATQDIFIEYPACDSAQSCTEDGVAYIMLREGSKISVDAIQYSIGGGAVNAATAFARFGCTTSTACMIGNDQAGTNVLEHLRNNTINTDTVTVSKTYRTSTSFILPSPSGNKTLLVHRDASTQLALDNVPTQQFDVYNALYISSLTGPSSSMLPAITSAGHDHNCLIACNPGMDQLCVNGDSVIEALKNIDIFILNNCEARELIRQVNQHMTTTDCSSNDSDPELLRSWVKHKNGHFNIRDYFRYILQQGVEMAVITNGSEGVYVAQGDAIYFCAAAKVDVVSTVGAGDAFGSVFVASVCNGLSVEAAIINGMLNSASVIGYEDAQEGLCSAEQLAEQSQNTKLSIQKFPLN